MKTLIFTGAGYNCVETGRFLNHKKAKQEVVKFQKQLEKWDALKNAAKIFYETFGE